MRFVQNAIPSDEEMGYSRALLDIDEEWHGVEVHALPHERNVIENDGSERLC